MSLVHDRRLWRTVVIPGMTVVLLWKLPQAHKAGSVLRAHFWLDKL